MGNNINSLSVYSASVQLTLANAAASEATALPTNNAGDEPRRCVVSLNSGWAYIKPGLSGDTLTLGTGMLIKDSDNPVVINTRGNTHLITFGNTTAAQLLNITPLED